MDKFHGLPSSLGTDDFTCTADAEYSGGQCTAHWPLPVHDPPVAGGLGAGGFDAGG